MMKTSFILYCNKIGEDGNWSPWRGPGKKCEGPSAKTESCNPQTCKKIIPLLLYNNYDCHWSF